MPDAGTMTETISKSDEVDPVFSEVMDLLYGDAVDPREAYDISKLTDRRERQITAGLSATGAVAGAAGLSYAADDIYQGRKIARKMGGKFKISTKTKALIPLEIAGLGGEVLATKILHNDTKKHIAKMGDGSEMHAMAGLKIAGKHKCGKNCRKCSDAKISKLLADIVLARQEGEISTNTAIDLADQLVSKLDGGYCAPKKKAGRVLVATGKGAKKGAQDELMKSDQVEYAFTGEISKVNEDKQQAFGWCSLSTVDGQPVVDLQGDYAPIEEVEKSAYAYVTGSRIGGDMHTRDGAVPKHTSDLIESFIATPEKLVQMGVPTDVAKSVPSGWWVGFQVNDADQWAMVRSGERAGFSIHGKGSKVTKSMEDA